jgi:hypothetical protein
MTSPCNRNPFSLACGCLLVTLAGPLAASGNIGETVGEAYDLQSGELLYRETHCVSADGFDREVIYQDADGKLIARKLLDYRSGFITPSFVQHNLYSNESIEVGLDQGAVSMAVIDLDDRSASKIAMEQPDATLPVVIDAGFDGFVRQHWDELVAGASREFQFPFADRQSLVDLRIQPLSCSYQTQTDQCFRLDLANWLLRVVVKPIDLGYDAGSRRLTRYRGLSNIGDANGNGLVVDIRYGYDGIAPGACQLIDQTLTGNNRSYASGEEKS